MARELNTSIAQAYLGTYTSTRGTGYYNSNYHPVANRRKYMEIPIFKDSFELPVFAVEQFINLTKEGKDLSTNAITALLYTYDRKPRYVSLDRYMRDIVNEDFINSRLVKCDVKQGNGIVSYYCTHGAVFNAFYEPMMMLTWLMQRKWLDDESYKYEFIKPILRISPSCYINQEDPMQRWIAKKAASAGLESNIHTPHSRDVSDLFVESTSYKVLPLTVEICGSPFVIKTADVPSISTTNEVLLQIAIDHIDEVIDEIIT